MDLAIITLPQAQLLLQSQSWPPNLFQGPGTERTSKISDKSRSWSLSRLKSIAGNRGFTSFFSRVVASQRLQGGGGAGESSTGAAGGSSVVIRASSMTRAGSIVGSVFSGARKRPARSSSRNLEAQPSGQQSQEAGDPMQHRSSQGSKIEPGRCERGGADIQQVGVKTV